MHMISKAPMNTLVLGVAFLALTGCAQTSLLKAASGNGASAAVENPVILGRARLAVVLDGKTYSGVAGESRKETSGEQALRFGWTPEHRHRWIKQEMTFLFGSTILAATDGAALSCDHLQHGDDWRLRCKGPGGREVFLQRAGE